uniref:Uncharacterized protein n=1 Tax=Medicago truncatula TaxID=3880 RepID=I3S4D9_MEDTR|nr:unknown [Medicago truncatula]
MLQNCMSASLAQSKYSRSQNLLFGPKLVSHWNHKQRY